MTTFEIFGQSDIDKMKADRDVKGLLEVLAHQSNADLQKKAIEALGEIGDASTVEQLIETLKDEDEFVRNAAINTLKKIGSNAVNPLITTLGAPKLSYQKWGYVGVDGQFPLGLREPDSMHKYNRTVREIVKALGEIGDNCATESLIAALKEAGRVINIYEMEFTWHQDADALGKAATKSLGQMGSAVAERLITLLKNEDWYIRRSAAEGLGKIGDINAVDPLIDALKDKDHRVRESIPLALGEIKDTRSVFRLIDCLKEKSNKTMRQNAAFALGEIGDVAAVHYLIVAIKDESPEVRQSVIEAMKKIGEPVILSLLAMLKGDDYASRSVAVETLDKLGWTPDLTEDGAWYWISKQDFEKCVAIGSPAITPLSEELKSWNGENRRKAIQAVAEIDDERSIDLLILALNDKYKDVRHSAVEALGRIKDSRAIYPLINILKDQTVSKDATKSLVKIGRPAVEPLIAALKDENETVRMGAAEALGNIKDTRAIGPLNDAIKDKNVWVSKVAMEALKNIKGGP